MRKHILFAIMAMTTGLYSSCSQEELTNNKQQGDIVARIAEAPESRTAVGGAANGGGAVGIMWTDGDALGVFDAAATAQKKYTKREAGQQAEATFGADGTEAYPTPVYAYYPYDAANDGKSADALTGTVPAEADMTQGTLTGDYKYGRAKNGTTNEFVFTHLFALARVKIDATHTALEGERLQTVKVSVTRGNSPVAIAGGFTFNALTGSWRQNDAGSEAITLKWNDKGMTLNGEQSCYMSMFPNVISGDVFSFEVTTENHRATFTAESKANFVREQVYNFPMTLNAYESIKVYDREGNLVQNGPVTDDAVTGEFTCAALNVDGLPQIINSDGPGADGTKAIGNTVNAQGWDFMAVSEDFEYHNQLATALSGYNAGTYRGSVDAGQIFSRADTDGLGFFWKKDGISAEGETYVQYTDEEGGLADGANTCIKKGFRHYVVTVAEGVTVDVYCTHMNTYSGSGNTESNKYVAAQLGQLRQLRDYVVAKAKENNRPAIIMGDTNMRYTRHDIKTNFIDAISADKALTVSDPWVEFRRGGVYPAWNTKSLMIQSMFKGDTENDICCADEQRGEVVDKMWYINVAGAPVQLKAQSCTNDVEHFTKSTKNASYSGVTTEDAQGTILTNQSVNYTCHIGLADHFPVVVKFRYTLKK